MSFEISFDRRRFLAGTALVAAASLALPVRAQHAAIPSVAFFGDRPILDPSGRLPGWRTPSGYRGGAAIAALADEHLRRRGLVL